MYNREDPMETWAWQHQLCDDSPCEDCHQEHIERGEIIVNAKHKVPCCVEHLEVALEEQTICKKHMEWLGKLQNGQWWCDQCGEADSQYNGHKEPK